MEEVFSARNTRLGRDVAIKILPERLADNAKVSRRHARITVRQETATLGPLSLTILLLSAPGSTDSELTG
jgi:hypothetical protein